MTMAVTRTISEAGAVEIPEAIREANGWRVGTELELIEGSNEVTMRPKAAPSREELFPPITVEEFLARRVRYDGPPITQEMMDAAVLEEAARRWHAKGG